MHGGKPDPPREALPGAVDGGGGRGRGRRRGRLHLADGMRLATKLQFKIIMQQKHERT